MTNFPSALLSEAIDIVGAQAIATNRVELHPCLQKRELVAFARRRGIHLSSFMTMASGKVLADQVIVDITTGRNWTPTQVALAWAMQQGFAVMPSSTRYEHLQGKLQAPSLQLNDVEMSRIAALDRNERLVDPEGLAPDWD